MIPPKCFTCGNNLSIIELDYVTKLQAICDNSKLSNKEKSDNISTLITSYKLQPCCNIRLMTSVDLAKIIL